MNTVKKGDLFEDKCYEIINTALINGELGLVPSLCKIYRKKKYYSNKRKSEIIFDISIEMTLKNSIKPTLVYIIECKDLNKRVPIDDIEEFESKITGLQGFQVKGVFVSRTPLQKSGFSFADNAGFMFIEVNQDGYNIVLSKGSGKRNIEDEVFSKIKAKLFDSFLIKTIHGLKRLSKKSIEGISKKIINDFYKESKSSKFDVQNFKEYLIEFHNLQFEDLDENSNDLGLYIPSQNKILINKSLLDSKKYNFVFFHEVAHYFLHKSILINKNIYDFFADSEFSFLDDKHILNNPKNWVEWQANYLASCIALPKYSLLMIIIIWQIQNGIRNKGTIFLDKQKVNRDDFKFISNLLSESFDVSKTVIKYRLVDLGILTIHTSYENFFQNNKIEIEEMRRESIERPHRLYDF